MDSRAHIREVQKNEKTKQKQHSCATDDELYSGVVWMLFVCTFGSFRV